MPVFYLSIFLFATLFFYPTTDQRETLFYSSTFIWHLLPLVTFYIKKYYMVQYYTNNLTISI